MNLLIQHLYDTAAVAEQMWDNYLPPVFRRSLHDVCGDRARGFFTWMCWLHDVGKATPAFQAQVPRLAQAVNAIGLSFPARPVHRNDWRHQLASAYTVAHLTDQAWKRPENSKWIWPVLGGHHGIFPPRDTVVWSLPERRSRRKQHGGADWDDVRLAIIQLTLQMSGFCSLAAAEPTGTLRRSDQLAFTGYLMMADWIASDERRFPGIDDVSESGPEVARDRAVKGWSDLGIRGGWGDIAVPEGDIVQRRFGVAARPLQLVALDAARRMPGPGLLVIEAPMGEGKTEAALGVAEVMAARFGADGVFIGMPTQATSDPMFCRTVDWLHSVEPQAEVALLHGRRLFNGRWRRMIHQLEDAGVDGPDVRSKVDGGDGYGLNDPYAPETDELAVQAKFGNINEDGPAGSMTGHPPAEWLRGRYRGLLAANAVGTIDHSLLAATCTKYVMLRYAGLVGKALVLDEVHAADQFMSVFLEELLFWLGGGSVPVVLLSATLAPAQREGLVRNYLAGATCDVHRPAAPPTPQTTYPTITVAALDGETPLVVTHTAGRWRPDHQVRVSPSEEQSDVGAAQVSTLLQDRLVDGGCALVIRNTVARAQQTFTAIADAFGPDAVLLHSRFTAADRARITELLVRELSGPNRPHQRVVVATQVAEQSFDVDADLLVTDLAPIDLILQRVGRLHRHARPEAVRPPRLRQPEVVVTGWSGASTGSPWFPKGSEAIYGRHFLLRSLSQVLAAVDGGWWIPRDIPGLVADSYAETSSLPELWRADEQACREEWDEKVQQKVAKARAWRIAGDGQHSGTNLAELNLHPASDAEAHVRVRDGESGPEILLLRTENGRWTAMDGTPIGFRGEAAGGPQLLSTLGGLLRLPLKPDWLSAEAREAETPVEWQGHPWLRNQRVVVLDRNGEAEFGAGRIRYDDRVGLVVEGPQ